MEEGRVQRRRLDISIVQRVHHAIQPRRSPDQDGAQEAWWREATNQLIPC